MEKLTVVVWHGEAGSLAYLMGEETEECYATLSTLVYGYVFRSLAQELADAVNAGLFTTEDLAQYQ